jgi:hypothetical protein
VIDFDLARSFNPPHHIGMAQSILNTGGFAATLTVVLLLGVVLDLAGGYTEDAFRLARLTMYPFWLLGTAGLLLAQRRVRTELASQGIFPPPLLHRRYAGTRKRTEGAALRLMGPRAQTMAHWELGYAYTPSRRLDRTLRRAPPNGQARLPDLLREQRFALGEAPAYGSGVELRHHSIPPTCEHAGQRRRRTGRRSETGKLPHAFPTNPRGPTTPRSVRAGQAASDRISRKSPHRA